jgi:hypothetical protein
MDNTEPPQRIALVLDIDAELLRRIDRERGDVVRRSREEVILALLDKALPD